MSANFRYEVNGQEVAGEPTRNEDDDSACILIHVHREVLGPDVSAPSTLKLDGGAEVGESLIISSLELLVQAPVSIVDENVDLKRLRLAATLNKMDLK